MVGSTTSQAIDEWVDGVLALAHIPKSAPEGTHLAVVLAPPSPELAGSLLGAASVYGADPAHHKPAAFGSPVSYVTGRKLYDSILRKSKTERRISLHAEFDVSHLPDMVGRPAGLEQRSERVVPEEILAGVPESEWNQRSKEYFRHCIRPVVILTTRPTELTEYVESLNLALSVWESSEQAIRFAASNSLDSWFRSPLLIVTPEQTRMRDWLAEVTPAAVIILGWKSWKKPARWHWPDVTHYLILDVRSEDVEDFRSYYDGTEGLKAAPLARDVAGGPATVGFFEPNSSIPSDSEWDEEIDLD